MTDGIVGGRVCVCFRLCVHVPVCVLMFSVNTQALEAPMLQVFGGWQTEGR